MTFEDSPIYDLIFKLLTSSKLVFMNTQRLFLYLKICLVDLERIELSTHPCKGRVIPLN
jgi:hypothetical protein